MLRASAARSSLSVFFLSGLLLSFLGAIIPAWGHHRRCEFVTVGNYFLAMNLGVLVAGRVGYVLLRRRRVSFVLTLAAVLAGAALLYLALVCPPFSPWWRVFGLGWLGLGAGLLAMAGLQSLESSYHHDPAATVNLAGIMFGLGCLLMSLLVAGTFDAYTVPSMLVLIAVIPLMFAGRFARSSLGQAPRSERRPLAEILREFKSPAGILLGLLLFFQFGNEWSIAGWLPMFLILRLGMSPEASLLMLAWYWLALLVGRVSAQWVLPRVPHGKLLLTSVSAALFGCTVLSFTDNQFGAATGILFIGGGFAVTYPLVLELIGHRFPYYHPGAVSGVFAVAVTGGLLAPATLGYYAHWWGISAVMWLPLLGSCMVFVLVLGIWLETKLSGARARVA